MYRIIFILLISVLLYSCNKVKTQTYNSPLKNCLLYIEDISGTEGVSAGKFGDIVIFNLDTKKKEILTDDYYYDASPTYSRYGHKIVFESKRETQTMLSGLANPSRLFSIDLKTGKISNLSESLFHRFPELIKNYNMMPAYNGDGTKLIFLNYSFDESNVLLYDELKDTLVILIEKTPVTTALRWGEVNEDTLVLFSFFSGDESDVTQHSIGMYNLISNSYNIISKPNWYFGLGDIQFDKLIYNGHPIFDNYQNHLFIRDLINFQDEQKKIPLELMNFRGGFEEQIFKNEKEIFFVGGKEELNLDIFVLNIETMQYERLSDDGHIKEDLSYIK